MSDHNNTDNAVLSVVIPTFNESERIARCLDSLSPLRSQGAQIIVVDGHSADGTADVAHQHGAQVISCARGRARQMNAGADAACARTLAFLHADTVANAAVQKRLWSLACAQRPVWGRFDVELSGPGLAFRVIETCMNTRSRLTGIATGDQLIFCSTELFRSVGGFDDIEVMEDIALSDKLRKAQRPLCCAERVRTSSRKWRENGVLRTVLMMWRLRFAYALGADPARLAAVYQAAPKREGAGSGTSAR